jgi:hypothetical protein
MSSIITHIQTSLDGQMSEFSKSCSDQISALKANLFPTFETPFQELLFRKDALIRELRADCFATSRSESEVKSADDRTEIEALTKSRTPSLEKKKKLLSELNLIEIRILVSDITEIHKAEESALTEEFKQIVNLEKARMDSVLRALRSEHSQEKIFCPEQRKLEEEFEKFAEYNSTIILKAQQNFKNRIIKRKKELKAFYETTISNLNINWTEVFDDRIVQISREKERLIDEHLSRQKAEENRHLLKMALMEFLPPKPDLGIDRNALSVIIRKLKQDLEFLCQPKIVAKNLFSDLDERISELKDELEIVQTRADLQIETFRENAKREIQSLRRSDCRSRLEWGILSIQNEIDSMRKKIASQNSKFQEDLIQNQNRLDSLIVKEKEEFEIALNGHKMWAESSIAEINEILDVQIQRTSKVKIFCSQPRTEETAVILDLEKTLKFKTEYLGEMMRTFQECKRKIVTQESSYNFRFGCTPSVAVLRPATASSLKVRHLNKKESRPVTASSVIGVRWGLR